MQTLTVTYGKTYTQELAQYVDRNIAHRVWTFREYRQTLIAYEVNDHVVMLKDDDRLDFTRITIMTPDEFKAYRHETLFGHDIENGGAPVGYQRQPITR